MKLKAIIVSLLETDLYKFSMGQAFITSFHPIKLPGPLNVEIKIYILQKKW